MEAKITKALPGHYLKSDNNDKIFKYIFLFLCFILQKGWLAIAKLKPLSLFISLF